MKKFLFFLSLVFCAGFSYAQNNSICDSNTAYMSWNNCLGTVTLANGNRYDGRFENGVPNGQGAALFAKGGFRYIGQFKNGEYNGLGILVDRNMKVMQSGLWTDGKFVEDQSVDAPPLIASVKQHMPTATQSMRADKPKPNEVVDTVAALPTVPTRESVPQTPITASPEPRKPTIEKVKEDAPKKQVFPRGNKLALVIGNDSYINIGKLKNAREDARTMAENLQSINYKVTLKLDVTQKEMKSTIRNFANSVQGGDEVVIFYAGHGVQIQGANYLLPIDLEVENEPQVKDDAVQLQRILDDMANSKARLTLAIIDACRNNPLPQGNGRTLGGRGLATTNPASGQMIIFSAGSGQEALDKLGKNDISKNGLFTRIFVTEMKKPGLTVDRILRNVRIEVVEKAKSINHEQTPAIYDQVVGDFYFNE